MLQKDKTLDREHYTELHPKIKQAARRKLETKTAIPARTSKRLKR